MRAVGSRAPDGHGGLGILMSSSQVGKQSLRNAEPRGSPRKEKGQRGAGSPTLALGPRLHAVTVLSVGSGRGSRRRLLL